MSQLLDAITSILTAITSYLYIHRYDFTILVITISALLYFLYKNKKNIHVQRILAIGKFNIFSLYMVRTTWGLKLMDYVAQKWRIPTVVFGFVSVVLVFIGMIINFLLLAFIIYFMFREPATQQVALVLPFTEVPGLGYLSFTHWIIAIIFLATIHEFAHGLIARYYKIKVQSSGIAVFNIWKLPFIPAAFVEPDQKTMAKRGAYKQLAVLGAGPASNILVAIPIFLLILFANAWISDNLLVESGIGFSDVMDDFPAQEAGLASSVLITSINNESVTNAIALLETLDGMIPGEEITLTGKDGQTFVVQTTANPDNESRAFLGVSGVFTRYEYIESAQRYQELILWTLQLLNWLFWFNLLIGLMNLMPLFITDGGQIVRVLATRFIKDEKRALRVYTIVCKVALYIILAAFIIPIFARFF